jgi:hypothetical protein
MRDHLFDGGAEEEAGIDDLSLCIAYPTRKEGNLFDVLTPN